MAACDDDRDSAVRHLDFIMDIYANNTREPVRKDVSLFAHAHRGGVCDVMPLNTNY